MNFFLKSKSFNFSIFLGYRNPGGWGYSRFQVTRMIAGFFWVRNFINFGVFLGGKIWWWQVIFWAACLRSDFFGYSKQSEDLWQLHHLMLLEILCLGNSAWYFLGSLISGPGFWGGLIFAPIQSFLSLKIRSSPLGQKWLVF